jgi:hypothetical protein
MEHRMSRRAAIKVLAAGAILGCSSDEEAATLLAPIDQLRDEPDKEVTEHLPVSYVSTEQLQDIHGDPSPGAINVYGIRDNLIQFIETRRVGANGLFPRIPIAGDYAKILLVGMLTEDAGSVSSVVSFMPLLDFPHDSEFIGPLHLKVLRRDQLPEGFDKRLFTNYLQNLEPVEKDGQGVTHAYQFSVKNGTLTEVSGQYLRPMMSSIRDELKLFIPEVSFQGFPLADLPEGDYVVERLAENLRRFAPSLEVIVGPIGSTGGVRLTRQNVYEIDAGYFLVSLERQQWQAPDGSSIIPIETAIESEFQGELRGAFGSIFMTKLLSVDLLNRILARSAARCVGLTGTAPLATPPELTVMTHGGFYHESPENIGPPEIMAFKLANGYPARPGNNRRRPVEVLREVLPLSGASADTLGLAAPSRVSAQFRGMSGLAGARVAPLPVRTNPDGSYGFSAQDVRACLHQNFEASGPLL